MKKLLVIVSALTLALVAAGCGSSGDSDGSASTTDAGRSTTTEAKGSTTTKAGSGGSGGESADAYAEAFVSNLSTGKKEDGNLVITEDQATCVAPKVVDAATVEALRSGDAGTDDIADPGFDWSDLGMTEAQAQEAIDAFAACDVDLTALFAESLTIGLTAEQQSCVADNVDGDQVERLLVANFSSGDSDKEFEAVIKTLTDACDLPG
jgi:hypothetical protein